MNRQEMIHRLIQTEWDSADLKSLWHYFEHYQLEEYAEWTDQEILNQYNDYFTDEQESECN